MKRVLLAAVLAVAGCATFRDMFAPTPVGKPSRVGWLEYELRDLRFEAPADWGPAGGERRIALQARDGKARLEITYREDEFRDEKACLADAGERLNQQAGSFERARCHPTRFGGRPAQTLEGDQGGWHVWAFAVCDGAVQYRVFFTAASPASPEALEAYRTLSDGARIGGQV